MAGRKGKYETHVLPHFADIKDALERGVEEKQIYESLGVGSSAWCDYKKKYAEFAELFKKRDVSEILRKLESALLKAATGYEYEEKKIYKTIDPDGREKKHVETTIKHQPPNVTAIFGAFNRFDPNYVKDRAYFDLKKEELEFKKLKAEAEDW